MKAVILVIVLHEIYLGSVLCDHFLTFWNIKERVLDTCESLWHDRHRLDKADFELDGFMKCSPIRKQLALDIKQVQSDGTGMDKVANTVCANAAALKQCAEKLTNALKLCLVHEIIPREGIYFYKNAFLRTLQYICHKEHHKTRLAKYFDDGAAECVIKIIYFAMNQFYEGCEIKSSHYEHVFQGHFKCVQKHLNKCSRSFGKPLDQLYDYIRKGDSNDETASIQSHVTHPVSLPYKKGVLWSCESNHINPNDMEYAKILLDEFMRCSPIQEQLGHELWLARDVSGLIVVANTFCKNSPQILACLANLLAAVDICVHMLTDDDITLLDNIYKRTIEFACYDEYGKTKLAKYLEDGAGECFIRKVNSIYACEHPGSARNLKDYVYKVYRCLKRNMQGCSSYLGQQIDRLYDYIRTGQGNYETNPKQVITTPTTITTARTLRTTAATKTSLHTLFYNIKGTVRIAKLDA